jgi:hypothetical protein
MPEASPNYKPKSRWEPPAVLLGIALVVFGASLWRSGLLHVGNQELRYGDRMKAVHLRQRGGGDLAIAPGRWYFVAAVDLGEDAELIRYLQVLLDRGRFRTQDLSVIVFTRADSLRIDRFRRERQLSVPILPLGDHQAAVEEMFGLGSGDGFLLIEPSLRVAFAAHFMKKGDIRQLLEKHVPTDLTLRGSPSVEPLTTGARFPTMPLVNLADGKPTTSCRESRRWVVFTSKCAACELTGSVSLFKTLEPAMQRSARAEGVSLALVFSRHFEKDEVRSKLKALNISTEACISTGELTGIEDPYTLLPFGGFTAFVVQTDHEARVTRMDPLGVYARRLGEREP